MHNCGEAGIAFKQFPASAVPRHRSSFASVSSPVNSRCIFGRPTIPKSLHVASTLSFSRSDTHLANIDTALARAILPVCKFRYRFLQDLCDHCCALQPRRQASPLHGRMLAPPLAMSHYAKSSGVHLCCSHPHHPAKPVEHRTVHPASQEAVQSGPTPEVRAGWRLSSRRARLHKRHHRCQVFQQLRNFVSTIVQRIP